MTDNCWFMGQKKMQTPGIKGVREGQVLVDDIISEWSYKVTIF